MPIFVPKTISYTPESLKKFEPIEDDPKDFIEDPEQFKDILPQPYRMLDKIVNSIIEDAWDVITTRESERMVEASKIKPPKYSTDIQIEVHGPCKSICSSPKGDVIFVGKSDGLAALRSDTQELLDEWKDPKMDIVNVEAVQAEEDNCLICTIDDLGIGRLFLFSEKTIYMMFAFNEPYYGSPMSAMSMRSGRSSQPSQFQVSKPVQKPIITKCQASSNGDYVGVCFESVQNQENWLDVFRISKESLQKELEYANNRYAKKGSSNAAPPAEEVESTQDGVDGDQTPAPENQPTTAEEEEERADEVDGEQAADGELTEKKSPFSNKSQPDKRSARFTAPQLVLKVRPPQPVVPVNFASAFAAQSTADSTGEVLGTGLKHQLTAHNLGMRAAVFEHMHEQYMRYPPAQEKPPLKTPTFHFVQSGRLTPTGLDQPALQGQPVSVLVWWEDQSVVNFYPLTKQAKDIEFKPELVWPLSEPIVTSTISPDNNLVAFGLSNNNIVVWDLKLGLPRKTCHLSDTGRFFKMQFLNPSICENKSESAPLSTPGPYKLASNCYLLVLLDDGQNYIMTCGLNDNTEPKQTVKPAKKDWEKYSIFEPLRALPELAVTMRKNGQVFVEDIMTGEILLNIEMPIPFKMFMPWQPVFAIGGGGTMLYIRGSHIPSMDGAADAEPVEVNSLFIFKLRSYRTLDKYRKKQRPKDNSYVVHPLMKERVDSLMKERISQQAARQTRMQTRWTQLKEELELIREIRDRSFKRNASRSAFSESTIARTPALELQRNVGDV